MRRLAPLLCLMAAACSARGRGEGAPAASAGATVFSREAFAPRSGDAGAIDLEVPKAADPAALAEILAAAPSASARAPTGADGGTAIGSETGVRDDADAGEAPAAEARKAPKVIVGKPERAATISNPALEQALRAQVYWSLTQGCRAADRSLLPPEAVHVFFELDADGYLVPSSILATPKDPRFADAARCMARELSTITFRAPAAARGGRHTVNTDVPSVD